MTYSADTFEEKLFVALYELDETSLGFFDTRFAPPKNDRPGQLFMSANFLGAFHRAYVMRNHAWYRCADGPQNTLELPGNGDS